MEALARGGWATLNAPSMGTPVSSSSVDLKWKANQSALSYDVYLGADLDALMAATPASPEFVANTVGTSQSATTVSGLNYWRVDVVTPSGTNKGKVWKFTYDSGFTNSSPTFAEINLSDAVVGDNTYAPDLRDYATDADVDAVLTFELVSGPSSGCSS